ncbi:MAG: MFS transporter [Alphaproteobacteria bacterium]|nr:MFS transporter [Alphaproteobacteria bacterium]
MTSTAIQKMALVQYGFLALPIAFAGFPLYILAPDFYAAEHGVSLTVLGVVLLALRLFDAVQDPLIGSLSDRFSHKSFIIMLISAAVLVGSVFALFHPSSEHAVTWFTVSMACAVTAFSVLNINLAMLGALWTNHSPDQTRISGMREAFGLIGLLLAVSLPPLLKATLPAVQVYAAFSVILFVIMLFALAFFYRWFTKNLSAFQRASKAQPSIFQTLRALPTKTRQLFFVYGLSVLASSIPAILVIFFVRDRLNAESYLGLFLLLYFLSGALAMALWKRLAEEHGKYRAWLFSTLLAIASFIWAFFLSEDDVVAYGVICLISGIALGADLALPPSILADNIHQSSAQDSTATQFSVLTLLSKAALAMASAIAFPLLDFVGFIPASSNSSSALLSLSVAYALIPCVIKLAAAYLMYRFFIQPEGYSYDILTKNNPDRSRHHAQ